MAKAMTFYDLLPASSSGSKAGLPLTGTPGLLVAFDAAAIHAVSPVTRGERYTIVTWFREREGSDDASVASA